ncbi:MAG: hypothetical protein IJI35_06105 [Kiritimatiellae bacterium]|nr:hypothetical protein [Kiritimatiellia bacterium]
MAVLAWVKSQKTFLKIQQGIGDNLLSEDKNNGFTDYVLWSTFRPECIDVDGELNLECVDAGMFMSRSDITPVGSLPDCYRDAFRIPYDKSDVIELLEDGV